ncbi:Aldo-keto reductase yakc [Mycena sanguinolenta]|uniref:Aldo-keto reductase yakc n=1 Tax=Mycena sanguinolenta TaxID=230812 RepID=A0A8H6WP01_9AGAR|nr:Aldo-keto reductase yakc [Mycena sanguinolenta]
MWPIPEANFVVYKKREPPTGPTITSAMSRPFPTRKLGENGPLVSAIGLGAGGISGAFYGKADRTETHKMLTYAADRGVTFWDTADYYHSCNILVVIKLNETNLSSPAEEIIGNWFAATGRRSEIFLATKFGAADLREGPNKGKICSEPSYIKQAFQRSLKMLRTDYVDLYYQHRVDPTVPIEVVFEALREFVESGQIKYLGLSEASVATLRRAKAVPGLGEKLVAAQMEYSPFELMIETSGFLDVANELGVAIVAYSPLGRGLITGRYRSPEDFEEGDVRRLLPRFSSENFPKNLVLVEHFEALGQKYKASPSQIALAWILAQHPHCKSSVKTFMEGEIADTKTVVPIPGTRVVDRLEENAHSAEINLSPEDVATIRRKVEEAEVHGARHMIIAQGDCIELVDWKDSGKQ